MDNSNSPFLGNMRVKNSGSAEAASFPALKTAFDTSFIAMLAACFLAGLNLYFRHMGVTENAAFTLMLFAIGIYFGFIIIWVLMAKMLDFAPRFRFLFAIILTILALLVVFLSPTLLYAVAQSFEATRSLLDLDKIAHLPPFLAQSNFFQLAAKAAHLVVPLGLVVPVILGFWFFWRSSPIYK